MARMTPAMKAMINTSSNVAEMRMSNVAEMRTWLGKTCDAASGFAFADSTPPGFFNDLAAIHQAAKRIMERMDKDVSAPIPSGFVPAPGSKIRKEVK